MTMDRDSHFFDLFVNTTHSSVHVPTNVYDGSLEAREFIDWSEVLDEVFKQNYGTDPALSWQYFGSNLGKSLK
jgi:voltage-dependent calcium channel alpha-2/delta-4